MKKASILFLQLLIVLVGIGVLVALLWEPQIEGVNAHATLSEIYFKDPFLAYVYIASIPFFIALYQAFKLSGYIEKDQISSLKLVNTLGVIKYCVFITATAIIGADVYLKIAARTSNNDPAGAIMLGAIATIILITIGITSAIFEKRLKNE